MKCASLSTLSVAIASIIILGFSATIIYIIVVLCSFAGLSEEDMRENEAIVSKSVTLLYVLLAICIFVILITGLLIVGIVKRRLCLMKPWIFCFIIGIACHMFRMIIGFIMGLAGDLPFGDVFVALIFALFTLGVQFLIFYPIYKLYKEIRDTSVNDIQEQTGLNTDQDNPPTYTELERSGKLNN